MKTYLKISKAIVDIGIFFLGMGIYVFYISEFTIANMKDFITTSGVVFGGLIGMTSLVLGYNAVRSDDAGNKDWQVNISTKFMLGTLYFLLAAVAGIFIIELQEREKYTFLLWPLRSFGFFFICLSWNNTNLGFNWLLDYLWETEVGEDVVKWWSFLKKRRLAKNTALLPDNDTQEFTFDDNQKIAEKVTQDLTAENPIV